jgi:hypothetical protein
MPSTGYIQISGPLLVSGIKALASQAKQRGGPDLDASEHGRE